MQTNNIVSTPDDDPVANDWRITAYVFDQLDDDDRKSIERLMLTDPAYRRAVEQTQTLATQLHSEASDIPSLSVAGISNIEAAIEAGSPVLVKSTRHRGRWLALLATAASLLVIGGYWLEKSRIPRLSSGTELVYSLEEFSNVPMKSPAEFGSRPNIGLTIDPETGEVLGEENSTIVGVDPSQSVWAVFGDFAVATPSPGVVNTTEEKPGLDEPLARQTIAVPATGKQQQSSGSPTGDMGAGMGMGAGSMGAGMGMGGGGMGGGGMGGMGGYGGGMGGPGSMNGQSHFFNDTPDEFQGEASRFQLGGGRGGMMPEGYGGRYSGGYGSGYGGRAGDTYQAIVDNAFQSVSEQPLSTFSIDVDTASYSKIRMMLQKYRQRPQPNAVRIEEMLNYFSYKYVGPEGDDVPFATNMELATCPWNEDHKLARIAIKGREVAADKRTVSNLVFLLDVSGSMNDPNKLPLVRRGLEMLVQQLGENDRVAIVVYAGAAGMVLDSTTADQKAIIFESLDRLQAGGSTNGAQGIQLAYQLARDHFIKGGTNRVILCTDGDFNVGVTGTEGLAKMLEQEAKGGVFLTVLGFGTGNLNDAMLEAISGRGDGNYAFIDSTNEAHKVLVEQLSGTLVTIAKDVKIQVEFNPGLVESYRLIGYENRVLAAKDFADDTKDAGEIGAGHTVTALYEIVPAGSSKIVGDLKYQPKPKAEVVREGEYSDELLTLKLRYKQPEGGASKLLEFPIKNADVPFAEASEDYRFASSVAAFGMLLRNSEHRGTATYESVRQIARDAVGDDEGGLRSEFISLIDAAKGL